MTNEKTRLHQTGLREALMFLTLLIPTFLVIAGAAVSLLVPDEPSATAAMTMAVCGPCAVGGE